MKGLTAVFGKGTGVSLSPWSPKNELTIVRKHFKLKEQSLLLTNILERRFIVSFCYHNNYFLCLEENDNMVKSMV